MLDLKARNGRVDRAKRPAAATVGFTDRRIKGVRIGGPTTSSLVDRAVNDEVFEATTTHKTGCPERFHQPVIVSHN